MAINVKKLREASASVGGGGRFWKPKHGRNIVRLFSFVSETTGEEEINRVIFQHWKNRKPSICQRQSAAPDGRVQEECEGCEEYETVKRQEGEDEAQDLRANERAVVNLVPIITGDNPEPGQPRMTQAQLAPGLFRAIMDSLQDCADDEGDVTHVFGAKGRNIRITFDSKAKGAKMYSCGIVDKEKSKPLPKDLASKVSDLFAMPEFNPEWYNEEAGLSKDEDGEEKPKAKKKPKPARPAPDEDEEPAEEEQDEEPAEEEQEEEAAEETSEDGEEETSSEDADDGEEEASEEEASEEEPAEEEESPDDEDAAEESAEEENAEEETFDEHTDEKGKPLAEGFLRQKDDDTGKFFYVCPKPEGWKKKQPPVVWYSKLPPEAWAKKKAKAKPAAPPPAPKKAAPKPAAKPAPAKGKGLPAKGAAKRK